MKNILPSNWVEVSFENIADATDFVANGSFKSLSENVTQTEVPDYAILVRLKDYSKKWKGDFRYVTKSSYEFLSKSSLLPGDLFIANVGYPGKLFLMPDLGMPMTIGPNGLRIRSKEYTSNVFLSYYYSSPQGKRVLDSIVSGTAQQKFNKTGLRKSKVIIPPLAEQQSIVAKLDELFEHLDSLKTRLNNIPQILKSFRQAVLTQAVTGKLTEEWRVGKGNIRPIVKEEINDDYIQHHIPNIWVNSVIQNIGSVKGGKRLPKGEKLLEEDTGYPYIRARDLKKGTVLTEKLMYLSKSTQEKIKRYIVATNDVYITIVGAKIGDAGIVPKEMNGANLTENAAKITEFSEELDATYFSLFLRSSICQSNIQKAIMSAAQGKLALTRIKKLPIYLPPKEEQTEIVKRVEHLFSKADAIEAQYQSLKRKIDSLPQAILAKAFKGELVDRLDTDGDAKVLLEEIVRLKGDGKRKNKK